MKLVRYASNHTESYAVQISEAQLLDVPILSKVSREPQPPTLNELISRGEQGLKAIDDLIRNSVETERERAIVELDRARLHENNRFVRWRLALFSGVVKVV